MNDHECLQDLLARITAQLGTPITPPAPGETCEARVARLYRDVLATPTPDADGAAYWVGRCQAGMSAEDMLAAFRAVAAGQTPAPTWSSIEVVTGDGFMWTDQGHHVFHDFYQGVLYAFPVDVPEKFEGTVRHVLADGNAGSPMHFPFAGGCRSVAIWESLTPGGTPFPGTLYDGPWQGGVLTQGPYTAPVGRSYWMAGIRDQSMYLDNEQGHTP